jgi:hypothetical protein
VRHMQLMPDHIVIYHGTTSFLRIGDISFIHMPTMTVSAIGELKAKRIDDTMAETSLYLIGDKKQLPRRMGFLKKTPIAPNEPSTMQANRQAQLRRQIDAISLALDTEEPQKTLSLAESTNIHKLEVVVRNARAQQLSHVRICDGVVAVGLRLWRQNTKLSSRLLPRGKPNLSVTDRAPQIAMEIIDTKSQGNSLILDRLHVGYIPGMTPIMWSPVKASILKQVVFREVVVWTLFNPLHLVKKLRAAGYDVTTSADGVPSEITIKVGRRRAVAQQIESFMVYLRQQLVTEDAVVAMIDSLFEKIRSARLPKNAKVKLSLLHFYGEPPPPLPRADQRKSKKLRRGIPM